MWSEDKKHSYNIFSHCYIQRNRKVLQLRSELMIYNDLQKELYFRVMNREVMVPGGGFRPIWFDITDKNLFFCAK